MWPASVIPPPGPRDWRALTRYRTQVVQERSRAANRVHGVLERAHLTLASVATAILGVSGRAILAALIEGRTAPAPMAEWAQGRLRPTLPLLAQAWTGLLRDHHRRLLALQLAPLDFLEEHIAPLHADLARRVLALGPEAPAAPATGGPPADGHGGASDMATGPLACARAVSVLDTMAGVEQRGAARLVAAWGPDMARFGTAARRSAWPGGETALGADPTRQSRLADRADAARPQGTSVSALYHRLAARRGKKRAIIAVAHSIVVSAFQRLSRHEPYPALGTDYFEAHRREHLAARFTHRVERFGYRVRLEPVPTV